MSDCLRAALAYAKKGFSVIPVRPDKKPYIKWTDYQNRLATEEEISAWWQKWPDAMVGIITGKISGLLVIDCDSEDAYALIQELLPDSFITCIAKTPRGYHLYLAYPKDRIIRNAAGIMPGVDIRGEGGYVVAPPSVNGTGVGYSWLDGLSIGGEEPGAVPDELCKNIYLYIINTEDRLQEATDDHKDHKYFRQGRRDDDLFHAAYSLLKAGCELPYVEQVLNMLALSSDPPFPLTEVSVKIDSALKRAERREGNIAAEVREWVETTTGYFETTICHKELHLTTKEDMKACNMALSRLCVGPEPVLEKHGNKRGCYRRVDRTIEYMDFVSADLGNSVDLYLPLDIHTKTKFFPKAVIVAAGVSGTGKTCFDLATIQKNMGRSPIYYFNSEMGPEALKKKLSYFPIPINEWAKYMKVVDNWDFHNIADKIQPDALNVIDYLEPEGDKAYNIHDVISSIVRRLNKGTALISIQKKPDAKLGTGGIYSIKAATLALSLEWGKIEIIKNRFREEDPQPQLDKMNFEIHDGYKFVKKGDWYK